MQIPAHSACATVTFPHSPVCLLESPGLSPPFDSLPSSTPTFLSDAGATAGHAGRGTPWRAL